jgi:hypothetical protein
MANKKKATWKSKKLSLMPLGKGAKLGEKWGDHLKKLKAAGVSRSGKTV